MSVIAIYMCPGKLTALVKIINHLFGKRSTEIIHLHQIAFQYISLCFSCISLKKCFYAKAESI